MATELEVFAPFDRPPSLSQLQAGVARLAGVKVVFEKRKEEPETEWSWCHIFQASSPDTGGFSIERAQVNRKTRETLVGLKVPREFINSINWTYRLSAPGGTEAKDIEMMYAAAGVLAKYTKGKVYDAQEESMLEADEISASVPALAKPRELLAGAGAVAVAGPEAEAPVPAGKSWMSTAVGVGGLVVVGWVVWKILTNLLFVLAIVGAVTVAWIGWQVYKKESGKGG